jgi:hypothetical protein
MLHSQQHINQTLIYGFSVLDCIESNSVICYAVLHTARNDDNDHDDSITAACPALAKGGYIILTV